MIRIVNRESRLTLQFTRQKAEQKAAAAYVVAFQFTPLRSWHTIILSAILEG